MSFLMRQVAHCDVCGHEWLTKKVPSHCAKCKSRKWNQPTEESVRDHCAANLGITDREAFDRGWDRGKSERTVEYEE